MPPRPPLATGNTRPSLEAGIGQAGREMHPLVPPWSSSGQISVPVSPATTAARSALVPGQDRVKNRQVRSGSEAPDGVPDPLGITCQAAMGSYGSAEAPVSSGSLRNIRDRATQMRHRAESSHAGQLRQGHSGIHADEPDSREMGVEPQ